jgi:hypothetical protein
VEPSRRWRSGRNDEQESSRVRPFIFPASTATRTRPTSSTLNLVTNQTRSESSPAPSEGRRSELDTTHPAPRRSLLGVPDTVFAASPASRPSTALWTNSPLLRPLSSRRPPSFWTPLAFTEVVRCGVLRLSLSNSTHFRAQIWSSG